MSFIIILRSKLVAKVSRECRNLLLICISGGDWLSHMRRGPFAQIAICTRKQSGCAEFNKPTAAVIACDAHHCALVALSPKIFVIKLCI